MLSLRIAFDGPLVLGVEVVKCVVLLGEWQLELTRNAKVKAWVAGAPARAG